MAEKRPRKNGQNLFKRKVQDYGVLDPSVPRDNIMETILHEYRKSDTELLRFTASDFEGKTYYHIRIYVRSQDFASKEEMWLPTKKGVAITLDEFPEFTKGLINLKEFIDENRKTDQTTG